MNNLDKQYTDLLKDILKNGVQKTDRTGTGTISVFGRQIRHNMSKGFPLLTTKKMYFKGIVTELLWFLRGDTNIKYLLDNDCHIWDGDAYKSYLQHTILGVNNGFDRIKGHLDNCLVEFDGEYEYFTNPSFRYGFRPHTKEEFINKIKTDDEFAKKWGELGPVYGKQWRSWSGASYINPPSDKGESNDQQWYRMGHNSVANKTVDQIKNLINDLKTNPDSRRLMVNAWNVGELDQMVLPPCHYGFQVYTRELSLEERLQITDKINKEIRQDLYSYAFNNPIYTGGINQRPDDVERHEVLTELNIPTRAISLMWNQRSVDTPLGLPFNIASYGLLLEMIAKEVNMVPDELIGNLGDCHIYLNQIDGVKEQIAEISWQERKEMLTDSWDIREFGNITPFIDPVIHKWLDYKKIPYSRRMPYPLPKLKIDPYNTTPNANVSTNPHFWDNGDFHLEGYQSHPTIKFPLSN